MARSVLLALASSVLLPVVSAAADQPLVTLDEAVRLAVDRHPEVGKARAASDAVKARIREVRSQALPEINIGSNALRWRDPSLLNASGLDKFPEELRNALIPEPVNLFDYNVTVKQPIYTAGKVRTAMRLASVEQESSVAEIDRAEQDIALGVVKAFWALIWAGRYERLVLETQSQKKAHADMARTRFKNGVATEVDALRSEVAVANGVPDVVRAESAIRQTRSLLNFFLGRPMDFPTQAAGEFEQKPWDEWDVEELMKDALRRRPELVRLRFAERSAGVQIDLAKSESRMRVDFTGAYGILARLPENLADRKYARWNMGLSFQLPVFDGFKRSGLVGQAVANERSARLERERVEQQVRLSIQHGLDELKAASESLAAARATVDQAGKVLAMMQNNYKYGAATTLDVLDAQTAVSTARTNMLRGLHDYTVARANLRWAIGRSPWE
jgi:outer membrane protein